MREALSVIITRFQDYFAGSGFGLLFFACLLFLFFWKRDRKVRDSLLWPVLIIVLAVFCPVTGWLLMKLVGTDVYWRMYWLLPVVPLAAYAGTTLVFGLKGKGKKIYLATNPIFPRCATLNRIRWAGLSAEDFEEITTYETCRYSKPNVGYYQEILDRQGLKAEECLMIGNDKREDLAAGKLGIRTYLVTECLEHAAEPGSPDYEGKNLEQLYEDLKELV